MEQRWAESMETWTVVGMVDYWGLSMEERTVGLSAIW
jgi:hypothetical protein